MCSRNTAYNTVEDNCDVASMRLKKNFTSLRSSSQRLGRCWKWNDNGKLDIEFNHDCNARLQLINPQPSEAMRIETQKKKYFTTFQLSTATEYKKYDRSE